MKSLKQKREEAYRKIEKQTDSRDIHILMADDMHPYNCDGAFGGRCIHCEERLEEGHDPNTCALCRWDEDIEDNQK